MITQEAIERLAPSHHYFCEHEDHPEILGLTFRTESSERYCVDHFPWEDAEERTEGVAFAENTTDQ